MHTATSEPSAVRRLMQEVEDRYQWSEVEVQGRAWRWLDTEATGPTVVLLPGSIGDGGMFVRTLARLGNRIRLVAVTYPAVSDPGALAHGLDGVIEYLGLPEIVLAGSSFGAYWAQFYALRYPDKLRHLIVGNAFVDNKDFNGSVAFSKEWVESKTADELLSYWQTRVDSAPASDLRELQTLMLRERQSAENLRARFVGVANALACPPLAVEARRVTVLDCDDDPLIDSPARARVRAAYPQAAHVSIQGGGHYPHVLKAEEYEELLLTAAYW